MAVSSVPGGKVRRKSMAVWSVPGWDSHPPQNSAVCADKDNRRNPLTTSIGADAIQPLVVLPSASPMRVLVAEDNPVFQSMLRNMLTKWGYQPTIARSGTEAWRVLESGEAPRLAVLDWMMPWPDGAHVCPRAAEHSGRRRSQRRAQCTANLLDGDHAAQDSIAVDRHQRSQPAQRLGREQLGDGAILVDSPRARLAGLQHCADGQPALATVVGALQSFLTRDPQKAPVLVDDRKPGPAVTEEEFVQRLADRSLRRDRHRVGVHDVGHPHPFDSLVDRRLGQRALGCLPEQ